MYDVVIALIPAVLFSIFLFGIHALNILLTAIISALVFEGSWIWLAGKNNVKKTIFDGSGIITAILLTLNLPPESPLWMVVLGSFIAIVVAKQTFGGLGFNIFNPALVARVFLLISFPVQMTEWALPSYFKTDAVTAATPLGILKTEGLQAVREVYSRSDFFYGTIPGSMGEVSAVSLLIGAAYLLYRKVITWEIPVCLLLMLSIMTGIFWVINPAKNADPFFHIFTGGVILGAFFMATDMVTSPLTRKGRMIFGSGIGLLTGIIRLFGAYPEGISFAILIMNATVPLIDRYTATVKFGVGGNV